MNRLKDEVIGKRIRQARLDLGFSQEELAKAVGLTRAQVANIETGRTTLSFKDAVAICDFLGLDVNELRDTNENELEALILFREGGDVSDELLIDWSDTILKELIAQEELYRKEGRNESDI